MIVGYYILPKSIFHVAASEDPFHACAHEIDDTHVICWARFLDAGHESRFLAHEGVESLPDVRSNRTVSAQAVARLSKYGAQANHTTLDIGDLLCSAAGTCMKLPY